MLRAIGLALADLGDSRVIAILLQALAVSLMIFVAMAALLFWMLSGFDACSAIGAGSCALGSSGSGLGAILMTLLAAWFLFPAVAIMVTTTFGDRISRAIEERHYPAAAREARSTGFGRGAAMGLKSAGRLVLFNLAASPVYLLLLVTGIGPFVLFLIVNGIALGRDLGELAASRHGDKSSRRAWLKSTRGEQHMIGILVSILFLIPVANLLAPVIGTAAAIHLFNRSFWATNRARPAVRPGC
jgi:uncharacterized protein involved in cysteine biosynthesis